MSLPGDQHPRHINEYLVYDETSGSVTRQSPRDLIANVKSSPPGTFVSRDHRANPIEVIVANLDGHEYLKTAQDGRFSDNLLSLYNYAFASRDDCVHVVSVQQTKTRRTANINSFIVFRNKSRTGEFITRDTFIKEIIDHHSIVRMSRPMVAERNVQIIGSSPDLELSGGLIAGEDALFLMPSHIPYVMYYL